MKSRAGAAALADSGLAAASAFAAAAAAAEPPGRMYRVSGRSVTLLSILLTSALLLPGTPSKLIRTSMPPMGTPSASAAPLTRLTTMPRLSPSASSKVIPRAACSNL